MAEKLHAYTRVYEGVRISSRAIENVFAARATHEPPPSVPAPPGQWRVPFGQLAQAVGLDRNIDVGRSAAAAMLDPILERQNQTGTWNPDARQWVDIATP